VWNFSALSLPRTEESIPRYRINTKEKNQPFSFDFCMHDLRESTDQYRRQTQRLQRFIDYSPTVTKGSSHPTQPIAAILRLSELANFFGREDIDGHGADYLN
jgi:hypothetical protein